MEEFDEESMLTGALADLRHACDDREMNFGDLEWSTYRQYLTEK
jgi:hypothetical protein